MLLLPFQGVVNYCIVTQGVALGYGLLPFQGVPITALIQGVPITTLVQGVPITALVQGSSIHRWFRD